MDEASGRHVELEEVPQPDVQEVGTSTQQEVIEPEQVIDQELNVTQGVHRSSRVHLELVGYKVLH